MWKVIYRHKKTSACPIAITIKCEGIDDHYPILVEKLKQANELGIDLPTIDNYEVAHKLYE